MLEVIALAKTRQCLIKIAGYPREFSMTPSKQNGPYPLNDITDFDKILETRINIG